MADYYDLCLRVGGKEALKMARTLGYSGAGVLVGTEDFKGIDVVRGVELHSTRGIEKSRENELVVVRTDEPETARKAAEKPMIDILFFDEMNYIIVKFAKKSNIAVGFDFSKLLHSSGSKRSIVLANYYRLASLVRKYNTPFVITSGALSPWDLRSPSDLEAFGKMIGLQNPVEGLSGRIVKENRKRIHKDWVRPGVESIN